MIDVDNFKNLTIIMAIWRVMIACVAFAASMEQVVPMRITTKSRSMPLSPVMAVVGILRSHPESAPAHMQVLLNHSLSRLPIWHSSKMLIGAK